MNTGKTFLFFLLLLVFAAGAHAQDVCVVTGVVIRQDGQRAPGARIYVLKTVPNGTIPYSISGLVTADTADANGVIELRLLRNSTVWLAADPKTPVLSLATTAPGTKLSVPDAATANLWELPTPPSVQAAQLLAVPTLTVVDAVQGKATDTIRFASPLVVDFSGSTPEVTVDPDALGVPYGDSLHVADSLARYAAEQAALARAAADSARLVVIARIEADIDTLRARADTAGTYDRIYIYTQIGRLYDSLGVIVSQLSALGSRVDTVGRAERAAIEAHNANQDAAIAAAGKWETYDSGGTYRVGAPKWTPTPGDTTVAKIDNEGRITANGEIKSATAFSAMVPAGSAGAASLTLGREADNIGSVAFYGNAYPTAAYRRWLVMSASRGMAFLNGSAYKFVWIKSMNDLTSGNLMTLTGTGSLGVGVDNPGRRVEIGGHLFVNADSVIYANNFAPASGTAMSFNSATLDYVGGLGIVNNGTILNRTKGAGRPYIAFNDYDLNFLTASGTILKVRETNGGGGDSAVQVGTPTATRGMHVYGGAKFEGAISWLGLGSPAIGLNTNGSVQYVSNVWAYRGFAGHVWYTGSAVERMRLTASGAFGIGVATPGQQLEIGGNMKMPPDSTAILGTVRTPFIVRDSLGWVKQDTMYVRRFEESAPAWTRNGGTHPYRGEVTFEFSIANSSYSIPVWGNVIADSANGVLISFVEVEMEWGESAQMNTGGMGKFFIANASLNLPTGLAVRTLYSQHVNYASGINAQDRGSYSNWGLVFTGRAFMSGKIKVKYTASSKSSPYFVKLEGF